MCTQIESQLTKRPVKKRHPPKDGDKIHPIEEKKEWW